MSEELEVLKIVTGRLSEAQVPFSRWAKELTVENLLKEAAE